MSEIKPVMFAMNLCEKCRDIKIVGDSCIGCKYRKVVEAKVEMNLELVTEIQQLQARLKEAEGVIEFYTHEEFREGYSQGYLMGGHRYDIACAACNEENKGKRARDYQQKYKDKE